MDKTDSEFLYEVIKSLMRMVVIADAERRALGLAMLAQGLLQPELLEEARKQMQKGIESAIQIIDGIDEEASRKKLLDALRSFEGPIQ